MLCHSVRHKDKHESKDGHPLTQDGLGVQPYLKTEHLSRSRFWGENGRSWKLSWAISSHSTVSWPGSSRLRSSTASSREDHQPGDPAALAESTDQLENHPEQQEEHADQTQATRPLRRSNVRKDRHMLGLKKPQRQKNTRKPSSNETDLLHHDRLMYFWHDASCFISFIISSLINDKHSYSIVAILKIFFLLEIKPFY